MKKILTINSTKEEGSTGKIITDTEKFLKGKYQFYKVYQIGTREENEYNYLISSFNVARVYYILSRLIGIKYGLAYFTTNKMIKYIDKINPDIVHIHCPNFYTINLYKLFDYLKKKNYPVVITNHAEFYYTGNCAYALECEGYKTGCKNCKRQFDTHRRYLINRTEYEWKKMKQAFENSDNFIMTVVSPWQEKRIKTSPIIPKQMSVYTVLNGIDVDEFKIVENSVQLDKIKNKYKTPIIFHATSFFQMM